MTRISLHRMFTTVANHATELPASKRMKLLHQRRPLVTLLRTPKILGIIHRTLRGRGTSRLHGPLAVGNGTRGMASGFGTDCIFGAIAPIASLVPAWWAALHFERIAPS